jgi:hypothetical protein
MPQTVDDLILETLQALSAVPAGQSPSAEDRQDVEKRVRPLISDLMARRVIYIANLDEIDDAPFVYLVMLLAEHCAPKFGRATDFGVIKTAEDNLRTLSRIGKGTGRQLQIEEALKPRPRWGYR